MAVSLILCYMIGLSFADHLGPADDSNRELSVCLVILNQHHEHRQSMMMSDSIRNNFTDVFKDVIVSSVYFTDPEVQAIVPIFPRLHSLYGEDSICPWFMLISPQTRFNSVNFSHRLSSILLQYSTPSTRAYFLGLGLNDHQLSITHHFLPTNFIQYPLLCAGVILSKMAVHKITNNYENYKVDFVIDPSYEFAIFLKYLRIPPPVDLHSGNLTQHEDGITLSHVKHLCSSSSSNCLTHCTHEHCVEQSPVNTDSIVFAVKTHQKNHDTRLPIMWQTWAGNPSNLNIKYFSDIADDQYNTIVTGVPNTERGHCTKLLSILRLMNELYSSYQWLVVCDDDTLLSVDTLSDLFGCHDHNKPIIIGEMYIYRGRGGSDSIHGYQYPTGGSGMVFSRPAVESIVLSDITCPTDSYPDDMFIGMIAASSQLNIPLVHSPAFHQDQPASYHPLVLESTSPHVSFHRHNPNDPVHIYNTYLKTNGQERNRNDDHMSTIPSSVKSEL